MDISRLAQVVSGVARNIELSTNTLVVSSIKIGASALEIKEAAGHFDFSAKNLTNVGNVDGRDVSADGSTLDSHVGSTSNPHSVTKSQVGLGNVDNVQQLPMSYLDTDITLAANSDAKVPSQKAIKAYVDAQVGGTGDFSDSAFRISDNTTSSKKIAFEASGISASTVRTITMPDADVNLGHIANLQTLSGVTAGATHLGTFTGSTIADNSTIKSALQSLETFAESLQSLSSNFEWQPSALDYIVDNTVAPPTEVSGDRYVLSHDGGAPHADWDGAEAGDIVQFNGSIWVETDPTIGMMISIDDEATSLRQWTGSAWSQKYFESTTASTGLVKVGFDIRLDASSAGSGLGFSSGVLSVNVDDSTIEINSDALRLKALGITNSHIAAAAAIDYSKLAALTASRALVSDGSGIVSVSSVTSTELGYLSGVTSAIQTQIDGKANTALSNLASTALNADIVPAAADVRAMGSASLPFNIMYAENFRTAERANISFTADTTSGNATIAVADTTGLAVGMAIFGPGIYGALTTISSIVTNTSITVNTAPTATATGVTLSAAYFGGFRGGNKTGSENSGPITVRSGTAVNGYSGPLFLSTGTISGTGSSGDIQISTGTASSGVRGKVGIFGSYVLIGGGQNSGKFYDTLGMQPGSTPFSAPVDADNTRSLGRSANRWQNVFALNVDSGASALALKATGSVSVNADFVPNANNTLKVGSSALNFSEVHSKNLSSSTDLELAANAGANLIKFIGNSVAGADDTYQMGSSSVRFSSVGTKEVHAGASQLVLKGTSISADSKQIKSVADPTDAQDAATKAYVDPRSNVISVVAGESFAANTCFAVRWGMDALTETAGRVYKADKDASSNDKFYVFAISLDQAAKSAGDSMDVRLLGMLTIGSGNSAFNAADVGKPVFLTSAGAFSVTAPSAANEAVVRIGMVATTSQISVQSQVVGIN